MRQSYSAEAVFEMTTGSNYQVFNLTPRQAQGRLSVLSRQVREGRVGETLPLHPVHARGTV